MYIAVYAHNIGNYNNNNNSKKRLSLTRCVKFKTVDATFEIDSK